MCGIFGAIETENVSHTIVECLNTLSYRGYDSAGIALKDGNGLVIYKRTGYVDRLVDGMVWPVGSIGIGHTRWATHGGVTDANAHPHTDCQRNIAIVHNGILDNHMELRRRLEKEGHVFQSETDSECFAHLLEGKPLLEGMIEAARHVTGEYAIAAISADENGIVAMRQGNPLVLGISRQGFYLSSDATAFPSVVDSIVMIDDGEVAAIKRHGFSVYDVFTGKQVIKQSQPFTPDLYIDITGNRMEYEMNEQPKVIRNLCNLPRSTWNDAAKLIHCVPRGYWTTRASRLLNRPPHVIFTGCGTSRYAGIYGRALLSKATGRWHDCIQASEMKLLPTALNPNSLVVALSQSGETYDVLEAVSAAHGSKARVLSLVNSMTSTLARKSDCVIPLSCGPEVSVASTKAFTSQLCALYLLVAAVAGRLEPALAEFGILAAMLETDLRNYRTSLEGLADRLKDTGHMYYIGQGNNFPMACEGALKMKEIAYIHAEPMVAREMKHGPIALIEEGYPVLGICPNDSTYDDMLANLHEAKARGAYIIGLSDRDSEVFDCHIPVPSVKPELYPIVSTLPLHMLAYLVSVARDINPDRPRNLAKSVTVK